MKFRLCNISFEVNYLFLSMLILYLAFDRTGVYLPLLIGMVVHEFSHIICLIMFSCKIHSIHLNIGAITITHSDNITKIKRIISILAGPFSNFLISMIAMLCKNEMLFFVNLILALYNLLPINGLDGGELIRISLTGILSNKIIEIILGTTTVIVAVCFILCCILLSKMVFSVYLLLFCIYFLSPYIIKNLLKEKKF